MADAKYSRGELAKMATETLAAIRAHDPRGRWLLLQLQLRFSMSGARVIDQLRQIAEDGDD